jgi:ATP phosphoribosyltransferase
MNYTIGLPNGSMQQTTLDLLSCIGLDIRPTSRSGQIAIEGLSLFSQAVLMRPQDIPLALLQNKIDCGICGLDWIVETELEQGMASNTSIQRLQELPYSRTSRKPARIVLFGRPDSPPLTSGKPVSISTEYPQMTQKKYPKAQISFSHGSTEIKVAMGQFDYGVCLTETGSSLRDNNLHIVEGLMTTPTVLIARTKTSDLVCFGDLLAGALEAERHQLIKMNIDKKLKETVLDIFPSLRAPTLSPLSDGAFAIETIVPKTCTTELIIRLRSLGATGIIVQDVNAILM